MYLIFDTETTGLPKRNNAPIDDYDNWPRLVQLAWMLCDDEGTETEFESYIIKPEGFSIPERASRVHGITTHKAEQEGYAIEFVLEKFQNALAEAKYVIGHNISFDIKVVSSELHRLGHHKAFKLHNTICTKEYGTDYCRIPGPYGYKWPSLTELHMKLFGRDIIDAHSAHGDVRACADCFFELMDIGVISI